MERDIRAIPVQVFREVWVCPEDGCQGHMSATGGMVLTSNPPQIPHACGSCGREAYANGVQYPRTLYRREDADA